MAKKELTIPPERLAAYDRLVASVPEIERKGASVPYTSHGGHMFSYLNGEGRMALKLAPDERQAFLERYQTTLFHAYGIVQKEFVTVPDDLLLDTEALTPYLIASFEYTKTLKPKPTKKA